MAARSAGAARMGVLRTFAMAMRSALRPGAPSVGERLRALPRMVSAAVRGEYAGLPLGRLLGMVGALVYVMSPVDLVPEGLLGVFGLVDDAMLVTWLAGAIVSDTEAFITWERGLHPNGGAAAGAAAGARGSGAAAGGQWRDHGTGGPQDAPFGQADTVRSHVVR